MNHRFVKLALLGALGTLLVLTACGVAASRAPLGGNYAVAEGPTARDRTAASAPARATSEPAHEPEAAPSTPNALVVVTPPADAGAPVLAKPNLLAYDPLKVGDKIKVETNVSFDLTLQPGNAKVGIEAKYRLDLRVTQASAQTLDELEVTVTPLVMRTRFRDHTTEAPLDAAEKFQVTLGRSPSVKATNGSSSNEEARAALLLLCTALADFHEHWARSPSLELKNGWSSETPVSVPASLNSHGAVLQAGPLVAKFTGRDTNSDRVPFELVLPASYSGAIGKLDFDFKGTAQLSAAQARPVALELSGPAKGGGGPRGELSARGFSKFSATFSYP